MWSVISRTGVIVARRTGAVGGKLIRPLKKVVQARVVVDMMWV